MTESMIVEAVRAVSGATSPLSAADALDKPAAVADPAAVARFEAAMGVAPTANVSSAADPIPFASALSTSWRSAQVNNQGILHRIRALSRLGTAKNLYVPELVELQYEVMNLSFQQEVVTKVADKSSNAIQTLIKNQ